MRLKRLGKGISGVEVQAISPFGVWVYVKGKEYLLSFQEYPWFKDARINEVYRVELIHGRYLHWPDLDVDLELDALENPEKYPLVYR